MVYVVCQSSICRQSYPIEYFGEVTKETKNVSCEKCGGVLIDNDGQAKFFTKLSVYSSYNGGIIRRTKRKIFKEKKKPSKVIRKK